MVVLPPPPGPTVIEIVAGAEGTVPSLTVKVKLSGPL